MFWIILIWITLQLILINLLPHLGVAIPTFFFYLFTFFFVIPLSLIIAHFVASRTLVNRKGKFANFLFGTTTILDILFIIVVPPAINSLPQVIQMETDRMLVKKIPLKERKKFIKKVEQVARLTVNLIYADPQLVRQTEWEKISNFWNTFATDMKDGKITPEEMKELDKFTEEILSKEDENEGNKNRPHRNSSGKRRGMGDNSGNSGDKTVGKAKGGK